VSPCEAFWFISSLSRLWLGCPFLWCALVLARRTAKFRSKLQMVTYNIFKIESDDKASPGRAMTHVVSRRLLTAEARVRSPGQSMWDLWWTKWHCRYHSIVALQTHIIWGMRNMLT
jgi:hypothetical protein